MNDGMASRVCVALFIGLSLAACSWTGQSTARPSAAGNSAFVGLSATPLNLPRLEPGQPCPQAKLSQPDPHGDAWGLGSGPVYVLSGQLVISDPQHPQKVAWTADPKYTGPISIRGGQIDGRGQLLLGGPDNQWTGAPVKTIEGTDLYTELDFLESHTMSNPPSPWRVWPSATYIASPGCYAWQVDGLGFTETISIQAGTYIGSIGQSACTPAAPFDGGIPEAGFDSPKGSLWMLVFGSLPLTARHDIKIVWRMTGSRDFRIRATDAAGIESKPLWGPEGHGSSSWVHPGVEVGIGFNFPHAGCWDIHLDRGDTVGDAWLMVV
jgi:hypothetical protein